MSYKDKEKAKEYHKGWYERHKDVVIGLEDTKVHFTAWIVV